MQPIQTQSGSLAADRGEAVQSVPHGALRFVLGALLVQMAVLFFAALLTRASPQFTGKYIFGFDFLDFFRASSDWLQGINPYLRARFVTPPTSLLLGIVLHPLGFNVGRCVFAAANLLLVLWAAIAVGDSLALTRTAKFYLCGIALLYYPVYFLVARGNLDGLVLVCMAGAVTARGQWLRSLLLALSASLKLYGILAIVPLLRARRWKAAGCILLLSILLLLPFHILLAPFLHALHARGTVLLGTENISPAAIFGSFGKTAPGRILFLLFWTATLGASLRAEREVRPEKLILPYLPWMAAMPLQVYPYTGVLLLPVLAWRLRQMGSRAPQASDRFFIAGFLLVGVQAQAMTQYFGRMVHSHRFFHILNAVGMIFVLVSMSGMGRRKDEDVPPAFPAG